MTGTHKPELTFEARDEFRREPMATQLINLLSSDIDISPLIIDGDWGTGKTEFCQKLIHKLNVEDNHKVLYIDAFKADHADNPLMTILSGVLSLVEDSEKQSDLRKKAIPVLRFGAKVFGKAILGHVLKANADNLDGELASELDCATNEAIDATVRNLLKDHEEAEANIRALQDTLASIASDTPIVIFIDELDRCRPDFSVQVLELIKHTFDIPEVKFVLVTNTTQLKAAINHAYGAGVAAERYLDKFIKFKCTLPRRFRKQGDSHLNERDSSVEYFRLLVSQSQSLENSNFSQSNSQELKLAELLIVKRSLSLREVETFARHIEIYQQLTQGLNKNTYLGYCYLRIFGIFTFCFEQEIAESILDRDINGDDLATYLGLSPSKEWNREIPPRDTLSLIAYFLVRDIKSLRPKYTVPDEHKATFSSLETSLFGGWGLDDNQPLDTVVDAIRSFSLGSKT